MKLTRKHSKKYHLRTSAVPRLPFLFSDKDSIIVLVVFLLISVKIRHLRITLQVGLCGVEPLSVGRITSAPCAFVPCKEYLGNLTTCRYLN